MKKAISVLFALICVSSLLTASVKADMPTSWTKGREHDIIGHYFTEDTWTSYINNTTEDGANVSFAVSYINHNGPENSSVQAFLLAFNQYEKDGKISTLPYQMFGMHYTTPEGEEVFIGAVLAFMFAYDDTYGDNGIPDPGHENFSYVIPFGVSNSLKDSENPIITPIPAQEVSQGHYRFGMRYQNLYAIVSPTPIASIAAATGIIVKFSELQVTYDITIDDETGEVSAETFYTIGQVHELWGVFLGIPFKMNATTDISPTLGIGAAHYVSIFTSKGYEATNTAGNKITSGVTKEMDDNVTIKVGNSSRAFEIGQRGVYDLIDENTNTTIRSGEDAKSILLATRPLDITLVGWQAGFSLDAFCIFAYGLSDYVQSVYDSPYDLRQNGSATFTVSTLWYATAFPEFGGYRIVYDPVYTAYTNLAGQDINGDSIDEDAGTDNGGGFAFLLLLGIIAVIVAVVISRKKKGPKIQAPAPPTQQMAPAPPPPVEQPPAPPMQQSPPPPQ